MGTQSDAEHQGRTAAGAGDPQRLALAHPRGDLHVDVARTAAIVDHDSTPRAGKRLLHGHFDVTRISLGLRPTRRTAKQAGKEIAEAVEVGKPLAAATGVPEALRPIRRRPELLPGAVVPPQMIVGRAFVRIAQHFVGLLQLFELVLGVLFLAHVGMVFARQLAIGAFHLFRVGAAGHTENFVVILILHASPCDVNPIDYRYLAELVRSAVNPVTKRHA